ELSLDKEELRSKKVCHRPGAGGTPRAAADAAHGRREQRRTTLAYSALVGTGGEPHHPTCAISARKCRRMRLSRSLMCRGRADRPGPDPPISPKSTSCFKTTAAAHSANRRNAFTMLPRRR